MKLPTDLPHEIAERAPQPDFREVLDRAAAGRRRRRTTIASGIAAVVTVGTVGLVATDFGDGGRSSEPAPTPSSPAPAGGDSSGDAAEYAVDPRLPEQVRKVLSSSRVQLVSASGAGPWTAAVWADCTASETCRRALVIRAGDQVSGRALSTAAGVPALQSVPNGWLVADGSGWLRVDAQGEIDPVTQTVDGGAAPREGDAAVTTEFGVQLLRGTDLLPLSSLVMAGYVTSDEQAVIATRTAGGGWQLAVTPDDGATRESVFVSRVTEPVGSVLLAGNGDHVVAAFLGEGQKGSAPVVDVQISRDAGRTWAPARGLDTTGDDRVSDVSSIAVAPSGAVYVTTGSHGLVRIDPEGNAMVTPASDADTSAFTTDDDVCVVAEAGRVDELSCSADDGTSWTRSALPGFR